MRICFTLLLIIFCIESFGQKFASEKSDVAFYSKAAIEDITAHNKKSSSLIILPSGVIAFVIPISDFDFAKEMMKEHFNEKYMESDKFPKATFEGTLSGFDLKVPGVQKATARGKLTIHGVTKDTEITGTMTAAGGKIDLRSKFMVRLADYNISIPTLLFKKIAEQVEVTVEFTYKSQ